MLESDFKKDLKARLADRFPGCIILMNNANRVQGFPDMMILFGKCWAVLECKRSAQAPFRPNQKWYVHTLENLSYAAVVYPENMEEILDAMEQSFGTRGPTRLPESQPKRVVAIRRS